MQILTCKIPTDQTSVDQAIDFGQETESDLSQAIIDKGKAYYGNEYEAIFTNTMDDSSTEVNVTSIIASTSQPIMPTIETLIETPTPRLDIKAKRGSISNNPNKMKSKIPLSAGGISK